MNDEILQAENELRESLAAMTVDHRALLFATFYLNGNCGLENLKDHVFLLVRSDMPDVPTDEFLAKAADVFIRAYLEIQNPTEDMREKVFAVLHSLNPHCWDAESFEEFFYRETGMEVCNELTHEGFSAMLHAATPKCLKLEGRSIGAMQGKETCESGKQHEKVLVQP